jgi:hypothetical protein
MASSERAVEIWQGKALAKYEAAKRAIEVAWRLDEIGRIHNDARQLEAAARVAKDTQMIEQSTEIRVRAERRLGEILAKTPKAKGNAGPGRGKAGSKAGPAFNGSPTLKALGIDKKLSARAQKLAQVPARQFEQAVGAAKQLTGEVSGRFILAAQDQAARDARRESKRVDDSSTEQVVIPARRPRTALQVASAIYAALDELANCELSAAEVFRALPEYQHYRIVQSLPGAESFVADLKKELPI